MFPWLALTLLSSNGDLSDWVKSRAESYEAYLRASRASVPGQLWHERPASEPLAPGFTGPVSLAPLLKAVSASVVNISSLVFAESTPGMGRTSHRLVGSGFIISQEGFVITNNHVIDQAEQISVHLADGREFFASIVGRDASTDVALLRLESDQRDLPFAFLGDSDRMEVGDWVVAIGDPFKLDHSVTHGMISGKERVLGLGVLDDFIQTDALINPGNSGGPLFNMRGEVIGVNTAIYTQGQGIGFAVPINMVKDLIPNLSLNGRLERGWLGVNLHDVEGPGNHRGAVVTDVYEGSPAAEAGIQPGDVIGAVNGRPVENYLALQRHVSILSPGTQAKLTLSREGASREVTVRLLQRPAPEPIQAIQIGQSGPLGLVVRDMTADVASGTGLSPGSGAFISSVLPGSPAERSGLKAGDVILELNRLPVRDLKTYREALERLGGADVALLRYQRGDVIRYVAVRLD